MVFRLSRRTFLGGFAGSITAAGEAAAQNQQLITDVERLLNRLDHESPAVVDERTVIATPLPPPESEIDFPIERVDASDVEPLYRPQLVAFEGSEPLGSLVVDPDHRFLYHVLAHGQARRYGVGVGRAGFRWSGQATVGMKRRWPRWVPTAAMMQRDPRARKWRNGQPGGPDNPLGARALYLFAGGRDTLYRIHGTNEPESIGKAVSSGCIRMLNQDVAELFDKVGLGTKVNVRPSRDGQA